LDRYGRDVKENTANLLIELVDLVTGDPEDDEFLGLEPITFSELLVQLGLNKMLKLKSFIPHVSELREACIGINRGLGDLQDYLEKHINVVGNVEDVILRYGDPDELGPVAADGWDDDPGPWHPEAAA
jgi:hypothetical protein